MAIGEGGGAAAHMLVVLHHHCMKNVSYENKTRIMQLKNSTTILTTLACRNTPYLLQEWELCQPPQNSMKRCRRHVSFSCRHQHLQQVWEEVM
jgi:hypothetical protein